MLKNGINKDRIDAVLKLCFFNIIFHQLFVAGFVKPDFQFVALRAQNPPKTETLVKNAGAGGKASRRGGFCRRSTRGIRRAPAEIVAHIAESIAVVNDVFVAGRLFLIISVG